MVLQSDINIDASKFRPNSISQKTAAANARVIELTRASPLWWEIGAPKFRQMRKNGETAFPKPVTLASGTEAFLPSRQAGRQIRLRVHAPEDGRLKGVFLHIHGGGWVLQDEDGQDPLLKWIADSAQVTVVSVGYRLAPEHPFPAGPEDCYDAAEWLVDNAKRHFGAELQYIGGESAGGHLSALTCFHLVEARPNFEVKGLVLMYGAYDLTQFLPMVHHFDVPLILTRDGMQHFVEAFLPGHNMISRRNSLISPFYANLVALASKTPSGKLPPAFFSVGTQDPLLDDTVLFANKWLMSGSEAYVKIYPGAPHGFTLFPTDQSEASAEFREHLMEFLKEYA